MKCIACGREMIVKGNNLECSNFLCDYEEDIDTQEALIKQQQISLCARFGLPLCKFSFVDG